MGSLRATLQSTSVPICEIGLRTLNFLQDINLNINQLKIKLNFLFWGLYLIKMYIEALLYKTLYLA